MGHGRFLKQGWLALGQHPSHQKLRRNNTVTKFDVEAREPALSEKKGWYYEKIVACRIPDTTYQNVVAYQNSKHTSLSTALRELVEKGLQGVGT